MMRRPARPAHQLHNRAPSAPMSYDSNPLESNAPQGPVIPAAGENIRIIPLGGVEEIGRNMTVIEYGDDIIVVGQPGPANDKGGSTVMAPMANIAFIVGIVFLAVAITMAVSKSRL